MTSCQKKDTPSLKNSEITSIETGNEELSITLLEDNFHLVIIESEENILNSIKENIEKTEALGLTEDKKLEEGEVALIGTIAASFSVALGAIVGLSIHKSLKDKKSRESLYAPSPIKQINLRTSLASSPTKMIELPDDVKKSLGLEKNISEKQLAESTLDKLDQGKSLPFESKDAADNVQNLLKEKFPSTEKEMRVIEVNGRFHLVSWQKMFTAEDKPFLVMKVETDFTKIRDNLAEQVKTTDYVLVVNPKNKKNLEDIETFKKENEKDIFVYREKDKTPDEKDIYILTNKTLHKNLNDISNIKKQDDTTLKNMIDKEKNTFKGVIFESLNTRKKHLANIEKIESTLTKYLRGSKNDKDIKELLDLSKNMKKLLKENLEKFDKNDTDIITKIKTYQENFFDIKLLKSYNKYSILQKKIWGNLLLNKTKLKKVEEFHKKDGIKTTFESDSAEVGWQGLPRLFMPLDNLKKLENKWVIETQTAMKEFVKLTEKEF